MRENGQSEKREIEAREKEGENQKMRDKTPPDTVSNYESVSL